MASLSCTTLRGGKPPSSSERLIDPRVSTTRRRTAQPHAGGERGFVQASPERIERRQPREERLVERGAIGAGERLEEMVVRVDKARQNNLAARGERVRPVPRG